MKAPVLNALLGKELRVRMRNWKSPLVISLYLGILGLIALAYYWSRQKNMMYDNGFGPDVGPQIFVILAIFQLLLIAFVTPALTAGIINGERERQTFDLLICTRISAAAIVLNKLLASICYILLLILASLPVFSIVYFFGGVLLADIGQVFMVYLMTALTIGGVGIFCSSIFKRTQISMVVSYLVVLFLLIGTLVIAVFLQANEGQKYYTGVPTMPFIIYFSPIYALMSIFPNLGPGIGIINDIFQGRVMVGFQAGAGTTLAPWQYNFILDAGISLILLIITIIIIDPVGRFAWLRSRRHQKPVASKAEIASEG